MIEQKFNRNGKYSPEHLQGDLLRKRIAAMGWVSRRAFIRRAARSGERVGNPMVERYRHGDPEPQLPWALRKVMSLGLRLQALAVRRPLAFLVGNAASGLVVVVLLRLLDRWMR
jgi:hypothetical protein